MNPDLRTESTAASLAVDVYWPMMKSSALVAAGRLGVFTALAQGPLTTEELARHLSASADGIQRLAAVLVQTGYIVVAPDDRWANSPHAQAWLSQTGPHDISSGLHWFAYAWDVMSGLSDAVIRGGPRTVLWDQMRANPDMGRAFAAYMRDHAAGVVDAVQAAVQLPEGAKTLLDVGGSHGLHAAAFCRRSPALQAVIYDLPVSLGYTPSLIRSWGLADRMQCVVGDVGVDPIPGTFDVITYFLVAHNQTDSDNVRIIGKLARALNPGGRLMVYEYPHDPAGTRACSARAAMAAAFDLTLWVETGTRTHTAEGIFAWLEGAGLVDIRRADLDPAENGAVFCGDKPR